MYTTVMRVFSTRLIYKYPLSDTLQVETTELQIYEINTQIVF